MSNYEISELSRILGGLEAGIRGLQTSVDLLREEVRANKEEQAAQIKALSERVSTLESKYQWLLGATAVVTFVYAVAWKVIPLLLK